MAMNRMVRMTAVAGVVGALLVGACSEQKPAVPKPAAESKPAPIAQTVEATVKVVKWGPQSTVAGKGFLIQPDGSSAMWIEQRGIGSANPAEVWFAETKLIGVAIVPDQAISAQVPQELLAKPGKFPVYLIVKPEGKRVEVGTFEVTAN